MTEPASPLRGVVPPLLVPLTGDRDLDVPSLRRLVDRQIEAGVAGIFALGSSGEVVFHDDDMRRRVLTEVTDHVAGRVPVIAGVIDMQTDRVRAHIAAADRIGVDGVVAVAPFYAITGPQEIETHFRILGESTDTPLWAYDLPICVHVKLDGELLVRLGREGVITGVKDSSGDDIAFRRLARMNREAGEPLTLLTGHEVVVDGSYLAGAHGAVPGLGNVDPAGYVRMHRAAIAGDWEQMRTEQERLAVLFEIVFAAKGRVGPAAGVGAFKTALRELGVFSTNVMSPPLASLGDEEATAIREILERVGLR